MTDYIKREDAIEAIEDTDWYHINSQAEMVHGANSELHQAWYKAIDIYSAIDSVPSADVAPVRRAKWLRREFWSEGIGMGETWGNYYECSACGERIKRAGIRLDNYCRKCGAEMDKSEAPEPAPWFKKVLEEFGDA